MENREMRKEESNLEGRDLDILEAFECILDSDPLIDEIGFIHPSQFVTLCKEGGAPLEHNTQSHFWSSHHKLGISTEVLFELYNAAKNAFMVAYTQYKGIQDEALLDIFASSYNSLEIEVIKHSRALLLLSSDFSTAWNSRRLVVSKKQCISTFVDELRLSALVLSYSPKSEHAWCHRRWVIKMIAGKCPTFQEILKKESELVEKIAEKSKMNYRAWNHRFWIVSYMTSELVLHELLKSRDWAALHVTDNSCFHYRRRLMSRVFGDLCREEDDPSALNLDICQIWKGELDWNNLLIKRYVGREGLWLHRRFISLGWINNFAANHIIKSCYSRDNHLSIKSNIGKFLEDELLFVSTCALILDDEFEDFYAQAVYAATYMLWLIKQIPESYGCEVLKKLQAGPSKTVLIEMFSEKPSLNEFVRGYLKHDDYVWGNEEDRALTDQGSNISYLH